MNLYGFAGGDPVNFSDPFGLCGRKGEEPCPTVDDLKRQQRAAFGALSNLNNLMGFFLFGSIGESESSAGTGGESAGLADEALVVRGGTNTAERIAAGAESIDEGGLVHGVSVNSANGASVAELSAGIPHNQVGVTTAGAIRAAGGKILPDAVKRAANPNHCTVSCMTPEALSKLLTPTVKKPVP